VRVMNVPDAKIEQPTDVLVKITTTNKESKRLTQYGLLSKNGIRYILKKSMLKLLITSTILKLKFISMT
jgi:hypothetical protein